LIRLGHSSLTLITERGWHWMTSAQVPAVRHAVDGSPLDRGDAHDRLFCRPDLNKPSEARSEYSVDNLSLGGKRYFHAEYMRPIC
jgi:hypothetical protein